ncbi:gp53-like domain-containing protein [Cellulomonas soli]|uniref:gp53-like domain-containing protein n=1 Tax=Cellulomonas soli TaxID=931535 RepID=UPI003F861B56
MPITSIGYAGQVTEANTADWLAAVAEYGVVGAADWRVSAVPLADRTVQVAAGAGWGKAISDTSVETVNLTLDPVTSGSTRWDLITAHRDRAGTSGLTTFGVVEGNADPLSAIAARARFGPTSDADDQPLALARIDAGSTDIKELRDLRCWSANGGMCAVDELVLQYLTRPGTRVQIGTSTWSRVIGSQGNPTWVETPLSSPLNVFGAGSLLDGNLPASPKFLLQAGTQVAITDASGYARLTFPKPFPNGLLTAILTNGDSNIDRTAAGDVLQMSIAGNPWGTGSRTNVVYAVMRPRASWAALNTGGLLHRVNWLAIGW